MNLTWYTAYHGDTWEEMCNALLALKHGVNYQPISDKGGDNGLDGLVASQGIIYQAYGQEPENNDPVKGVKGKIHKDLAKLDKNKNSILEIIGTQKISRWVLLLNKEIPSNDLHAYIKKKQDEVISWGLSFIASDFQVLIQPPSYFHTEYLELEKKRDDRIEVDVKKLTAPSMESIRRNTQFIAVLEKFKKITDEKTAEEFAYDEIKQYIENAAQLDLIQKEEPDFYSEIENIRSDVESDAKQGSILSGTYNSMANTQNTLEQRLNNKIGSRLGGATLRRVRKFIIADWFVRCPLNFKSKDNKSQ